MTSRDIIIGAMLFQNPRERNTTINNHFDKSQFIGAFNCTQILTKCTHFLWGVRKLYHNRYSHTQKDKLNPVRLVFMLFIIAK